jgi:hypothetical protein
MQLPNEAIELSKTTFSETVDMVDGMEESGYSEAVMILQLLRENHQRWEQAREQSEL